MPKQAKPLTPKRVTKRKPIKQREIKPFRRLVFTDLHVDGDRLDRALRALDMVGDLAERHDATPVCLGDFWHLRGHWMVRHVEEVMKRVEAWRPSIFIPGNHDQVSIDGQIHGLNIFRLMQQHTVATDPYYDDAHCAYLPWRELPEQQRAQLEHLAIAAEEGWTVFAHAEVGGALANSGYKTPGIIQVEDIERVARACYVGHYHQRQKLGDRTWYIGPPYQQNMGERDWSHGVALVTHESIEPEFIELKGFPKYWRLSVDGEWDPKSIGASDIVELQAPPELIGTDDFHSIVERIPTQDVRPVPIRPPDAESAAPAFALTLDDAVAQWAAKIFEDEFGESPVTLAELIETGREVLGTVPEARAIPPLGSLVQLASIRVRDFCALRGELTLDGLIPMRALVHAPIRTGKTALLDAPMWCLYGETTPRKAGSVGATLRADSVIHDEAADCEVSCEFIVDGDKRVTITRTKKRGHGSKAEVSGIAHPDGISDQDALIRHVVGYGHPLWRACVGLGQGAVANFATDADKRRKDLLNEAFGLEACPKAQKAAKGLRDAVHARREQLGIAFARLDSEKSTLLGQDFTAQSTAWEQRRQASVDALQRAAGEALAKEQQCGDLLKGETAWADARRQHDEHLSAMTKRLAALRPTVRIGELQRQYGAVEAEKAIAQRDLNQARAHYSQLVAVSGVMACPSCGQALPEGQREQHIQEAEAQERNAQMQLTTAEHKLSNLAQQLHALNEGNTAEQQSVEAAIAESRDALTKCNDAIAQFARIRANLEAAQAQRVDAERRAAEEGAAVNPFDVQASQSATRIAELQAELDRTETEIGEALSSEQRYDAWVTGFGSKGIPTLVLRTALYDLETAANRYLVELLNGSVYCQLSMDGDDLKISYYETTPDGATRERSYEQLSGGQRRCVELAFAPFALGDMVYARCGVRISLLLIDELTTHMGAEEKSRACALLERVNRDTVLVADHDISVQGFFDTKLELRRVEGGMELEHV